MSRRFFDIPDDPREFIEKDRDQTERERWEKLIDKLSVNDAELNWDEPLTNSQLCNANSTIAKCLLFSYALETDLVYALNKASRERD